MRVAKDRLGLSEDDYRAVLENYGGVSSATELDRRGFSAVMDHFRDLGFVTEWWTRNYGYREGMATPAQVELVRILWREVDDGDKRHLDAWLTKYHKISSLRFATSAKVGQIIDALKARKARLRIAHHGD